MSEPTNRIRVPKPAAGSFNLQRPISKNSLLESQVKQLHHLEQELRKQLDSGIQYHDIKTEGEAAEYIRRMTAILHPHPQPKK